MNTLAKRLYGDYLMPSRLGEYASLLQLAQAAGYVQLSVRAFFRSLDATTPAKAIVHRHDIDSDLRTARKMFDIETRHGVRSSFYFRLSTLDFGFMRAIEAYGSEASYHYEEVADFAKANHLKDPEALRRRFPEIRMAFLQNYEHIQDKLGIRLVTVASHGDFANRRLNTFNHEILRDRAFRARCGIECESYDAELLRQFDIYISDRPHPQYYHPLSPFAALGQHKRICLLTHPVQWETNWLESTRCNLRRLVEGLRW